MRKPDSLSEKVKSALLQDNLTRDSSIEVFQRRGIVLLWGEVETEVIALEAERIAAQPGSYQGH